MKKTLKAQMTFLLFGFVFWLPVAVVLYLAVLVLSDGDKIGNMILGVAVPDKYLHFGIGFILCILIIYFSGMLLKLTSVGKVLSKIPIIGLFFGQGEIMTIARLAHMQACLFLFSPTSMCYGWILSEEKVKLSHKDALFPIINVFHPDAPTLVIGQVYAVRKDTVMKLANTSTEIIDLLLYAFRSPAALEFVPWEDETLENFEERSKYFGLKLDTGKKGVPLHEIHPV